jgi:uncharacterized protein YbaA (DUF1428 family)
MDCVDGFVAAVPTASQEAYISFAGKMAGLFREYGALRVVETWGDDVPDGVATSFPLAVQRKDDETVVFSWVVWPSKQVRDAGWKSLAGDPRMSADQQMPFDGKRLIYGGFKMIVDQ